MRLPLKGTVSPVGKVITYLFLPCFLTFVKEKSCTMHGAAAAALS